MDHIDFAVAFQALTGNPPFPWQQALYERFVSDRSDNIPSCCNLPTGLGKTSVIAIWLIALANFPEKLPRRLVYVVNRRTVVDQTTNEIVQIRNRLVGEYGPPPEILWRLRKSLEELSATPANGPLAISTLRGQFADNREWSADPSRPAVICGTVDMIGSRLLFSGYGVGFKGKPLHAGFLGQDALLIHDEAHLEPAFQILIAAIEKEQKRCNEFAKLKVMALSATSRKDGDAVFALTAEEKSPEPERLDAPEPLRTVWKRITAKKGIQFHSVERSDLAKQIGKHALRHKETGKAVLVFVRTVEDVNIVKGILGDKKDGVPADQIQILTGTLRGLERDRLPDHAVFKRFLLKTPPDGKTLYLVCTSAGEVGIDISADHMVCDLTPFDSMAQRLGRVNRRGDGAAEVDIFYETDPDPKKKDDELEKSRWHTLEVLKALPNCQWIGERLEASPHELSQLTDRLTDENRKAAFSPLPTILPTSDILFDSWALTTIREKLPGRPMVEPYLHGISDWEPPETHIAWREEVSQLDPKYKTEEQRRERQAVDRKSLAKLAVEMLDDYPLKPHELLREPSYRAFKHFESIAKRRPGDPVWLLDDDGKVEVLTIEELASKDDKERIEGKTVLLPPSAGGLKAGMLDGTSPTPANDVADAIFVDNEQTQLLRVRVEDPEDVRVHEDMRLIRRIALASLDDDEDAEGKSWYWFGVGNNGDKSARLPVQWRVHVDDVIRYARAIVANLPLDQKFKDAIIVAAQLHDHGKKRHQFQAVLRNRRYPDVVLAKSGKKGGRIPETYRHELGSLLEVATQSEFMAITDPEMKELVLHLIAAHHGRARPHFPEDEAFDPEPPAGSNPAEMAMSIPRRFARLQRKYGRWGLAYLESLLRAADWAASAKPSEFLKEDEK